jgi:acyl transferase domain-containing protein/SAM-dependent methyltransferase/acyl carrier protein/ribosomal protein S18 acetylase RimI-like enzyme
MLIRGDGVQGVSNLISQYNHRILPVPEEFFAALEGMILSAFNRQPVNDQPKYVADMSCGRGSLLKRAYDLISCKSSRGAALDEHPVFLIGFDYDGEALRAAESTLSPIPHILLKGDIADPAQIIEDLKARGIADPENAVYVRSFPDLDGPGLVPAYVSGARADRSLAEHLGRWSAAANRHGLIIAERHCIRSDEAGRFSAEDPGLPFDAHHTFSRQHRVEAEAFLAAAAGAGLFPKPCFSRKFPEAFPFAPITLNWFEKRPYIVRNARPDDLPELESLEEKCWPQGLRTSPHVIQSRIERFAAGHQILEMEGRIAAAIYSQRLSSVDIIKGADCETCDSLHTPHGPVIHILGLSVRPEFQDRALGDQLLEYMLQRSALVEGVERVVGVTRCRSFGTRFAGPMEVYVHTRDENGLILDPILQLHERHGAAVTGIIPQYRTNDRQNEGNGVLVEYDLGRRSAPAEYPPASSVSMEKATAQGRKAPCRDIINECVRSLMEPAYADAFSPDRPLKELGLDSLDLMRLRCRLGCQLGEQLDPAFFFRHPTPESIAEYFEGKAPSRLPSSSNDRGHLKETPEEEALKENDVSNTTGGTIEQRPSPSGGKDAGSRLTYSVAIIGISCRFPNGANGVDKYWAILRDGVDAITEVPESRWDTGLIRKPDLDGLEPESIRFGGFLDQIDMFDAQFFRIAPIEANHTDPQHRILLETAWEGLENAGINPEGLRHTQTGIFVGIGTHDYEILQIKHNEREGALSPYFATGNSSSVAAGRLAYFLGCHGPAISVDTACSSSLVAVHLACRSLLQGECDLALAAGVNLILTPEVSITYSKAGMLAGDGRCKTFDASADGYVRSEGCGLVVLKRMDRALHDNDNVLAVIAGSAVNQDGPSNGLTAPNGLSQEALIQSALKAAGVSPPEISYVEAHGTGTSLGDPVEVGALEAVYGQGRPQDQPLVIGSVKTNIGHAEAAAGIAGLIKVVLSLSNNFIPPHLHFKRLNPLIRLDAIPAVIPSEGVKWEKTAGKPRLAGVSSFGSSGTNCHLIIGEAPALPQVPASPGCRSQLFAISAAGEEQLGLLAKAFSVHLRSRPEACLADICQTLGAGRKHFSHRLALVAESVDHLRRKLDEFVSCTCGNGWASGRISRNQQTGLAFLFTGQGSQHTGMGRELFEAEQPFRRALETCDEILRPILDTPLLDVLYPGPGATSPLDQTGYTQPALFALEYALAALWESWGIEPGAVMGHSVGEYVAACIAGVFSLEDGLRLLAARARLMQSLPDDGMMAAAFADEKRVAKAIEPYSGDVSIAALNGPANTVISGRRKCVVEIATRLEEEGVQTFGLAVSHAFHSPLMEPILAEFREIASQVSYSSPRIDLISNVTGLPATDEITGPDYWCTHVRRPVQFAAGMATLRRLGCELFVELGPRPILIGMGQKCALDLPSSAAQSGLEWLPSLHPGVPDRNRMLKSLCTLYVHGHPVEWHALNGDRGYRKTALPTYRWKRSRHWIGPIEPSRRKPLPPVQSSVSVKNQHLYEVNWLPRQRAGFDPAVLPPDYLPSPDRIVGRVLPVLERLRPGGEPERYAELLPQLESLCAQYVVKAFERLGWRPRAHRRATFETLAERMGIVPQHHRLTGRLLEMLEEDGVVQKIDGEWEVLRVFEPGDPQRRWERLQEEFPAFHAELSLLGRCGEQLAEVLRGQCDPVELLFPQGSLSGLEDLYQGSPLFSMWNLLAQATVATALEALPAGRTARMLEIGAGTGSTTALVAEVLPADRTEYCFTDISSLFLTEAGAKFKQYPFMRFQLLDIEKDPVPQGFTPNSFDVVLAANVLHATADLGRTLAHIRKLLAPQGLVVFLELTRRVRWIDLIFGLTKGWWRFSDSGLRPSYPLLDRQKWLDLLEQQGFTGGRAVPGTGAESEKSLPHTIFVARGPKGDHPGSNQEAGPAAKSSGAWLVLADGSGIGRILAERIRLSGQSSVLVFPDKSYSPPVDGIAHVDPENSRHFQRLLAELTAPGRPPVAGIVHLWCLDSSGPGHTTIASLEREPPIFCGSALHSAQALMKAGMETRGRLWLVTRGAQPCGYISGSLALAQAPAWGLGRAIGLEHPEIWGGMVDLDPDATQQDCAARIFEELRYPDGEDQLAFRRGRRFVARLERSRDQQVERASLRLRPDAAYLITGGLGGLGLKVARWMAEEGARHLVLLGRRGLTGYSGEDSLSPDGPRMQKLEAIRAIEHLGATVRVVSADVGDHTQMSSLFKEFGQSAPPLRGIAHAAAYMGMTALEDLGVKDLERAFRAKVSGAWVLHLLTRQNELDFFVLFSSGAALWGSRDLAHYAAANQFLDVLAHYRRSHGLPALSINWGWWAGGGTSREAERYFAQIGFNPMSDEECLQAIADLLASGAIQKTVSKFDWKTFGAVLEARRHRPFLENMTSGHENTGNHMPGEDLNIIKRLKEAGSADRRGILSDLVRTTAARILGFERPELLDPKQGFFSMGMDSITTLQFKSRLEASLGQTFPQTLAFEHPNVEALSAYLATEVLRLEQPAGHHEKPPVANGPTAQDGIDDLSEEDLVEMISQRLKRLR